MLKLDFEDNGSTFVEPVYITHSGTKVGYMPDASERKPGQELFNRSDLCTKSFLDVCKLDLSGPVPTIEVFASKIETQPSIPTPTLNTKIDEFKYHHKNHAIQVTFKNRIEKPLIYVSGNKKANDLKNFEHGSKACLLTMADSMLVGHKYVTNPNRGEPGQIEVTGPGGIFWIKCGYVILGTIEELDVLTSTVGDMKEILGEIATLEIVSKK